MNILPKKRWHVRTRDNIARVRRDEALAAEEEKKKHERIELAEKEARTEILRSKARDKYGYIQASKKEEEVEAAADGHINFFYELERNEAASKKTNADHEKEAKNEREKEEMKIGYLTYLGQDTNELTGNVSWYNKVPEKREAAEEEVGIKEKLHADPLKNIRKYLDSEGVQKLTQSTASHTGSIKLNDMKVQKLKSKCKEKKRKHKKKKKSKSSTRSSSKLTKSRKRRRCSSSSSECSATPSTSQVNIQKLREDRIRRERLERERAAAVLARLQGQPEAGSKSPTPAPDYLQKYSSQFNPHLARQNFPT